MWEKFKDKTKSFFSNRAAVLLTVLVIITLAVVVVVTVALNRAKKNPNPDDQTLPSDVTTEGENVKTIGTSGGDLPIYAEDTQADPVSKSEQSFALPVSGTLSKEHDAGIQVWSSTMGDYRVHLGIDIAAEKDAPVYAAADGVIEKIWEDPMMGVCLALTHENDIRTVYKNLDPTLADGIKTGAEVKSGQQLGVVGESAVIELADEPHLHFEMTANGLSVNPLDYFCKEAVQTLSTDTNYEDMSDAPSNETSDEMTTVGK